jgi:hypothetical protein
MTELDPPPVALPTTVRVTESFSRRMPTQRTIDTLERVEGVKFGELIQTQPFRVVAFRALLRDRPDYDPSALWLHSYDCEVEIVEVDPTNGHGPTPAPRSVPTGT